MKKIGVLILAAGMSRRMGTSKALLNIGNLTFIEHILYNPFLKQSRIHTTVVLGHDHETIRLVISPHYTTVYNERYAEGRMTSVQAGIQAIHNEVDGVFVMPVDCPLVTTCVFESVINAFSSPQSICIPSYNNRRGHPPLIGNAWFDEILSYSEDQSLRTLYEKYHEKITHVPVETEAILHNINTPDDYQKIILTKG